MRQKSGRIFADERPRVWQRRRRLQIQIGCCPRGFQFIIILVAEYSLQVPTVLQLVEEIDAFSKAEEESEVKRNSSFYVTSAMSIQVKRTVKAYKMTSMREPVSIFEEFLSGLASERKGQLIAQSDAKMEI